MIRESLIERHLVKSVHDLGGWTRKVSWIGRRGAPDRLIAIGERHCYVETKRPNGPAAERHQSREHARMRAAGMAVYVAHTKADVDTVIAELCA